MKKFRVPKAQNGEVATLCMFFAMHGTNHKCDLDPSECYLKQLVEISEDGNSARNLGVFVLCPKEIYGILEDAVKRGEFVKEIRDDEIYYSLPAY